MRVCECVCVDIGIYVRTFIDIYTLVHWEDLMCVRMYLSLYLYLGWGWSHGVFNPGNTSLTGLSLSLGPRCTQKGNAEETKHFYDGHVMSLESRGALIIKMTSCRIWFGGKPEKSILMPGDGENRLLSTFPMDISTNWIANSLIQYLNSNRQFHFYNDNLYQSINFIANFGSFLLFFSLRYGQISPLAFFRWLTAISDRNAESCNCIPSNYCLP